MTALTVIIFILQLVLVAWAAGITALYFQLVRTIRKISAADQEAFTAIFENESDILHTVSAALKTVEAVENEATAYKEAIDEELEKSRKTSDFALKTIQEARRIYRQATEVAGSAQPADSETFVQQIREKIQEDADGEQ
jgi:hypothetical protein